jgi:hypothetical protein
VPPLLSIEVYDKRHYRIGLVTPSFYRRRIDRAKTINVRHFLPKVKAAPPSIVHGYPRSTPRASMGIWRGIEPAAPSHGLDLRLCWTLSTSTFPALPRKSNFLFADQ